MVHLRIRVASRSTLYSLFEEAKEILDELRLDHIKDGVDRGYQDSNFCATYYLGRQNWMRMVVFENLDLVFKFYFDSDIQITTRSLNFSSLKSFLPELEAEIDQLLGFPDAETERLKLNNPDYNFLKSIGIQGKLKLRAYMTTVCAWCGKFKDTEGKWVDHVDQISEPLTHGICPTCAAEVRKQFNAKLRFIPRKSAKR